MFIKIESGDFEGKYFKWNHFLRAVFTFGSDKKTFIIGDKIRKELFDIAQNGSNNVDFSLELALGSLKKDRDTAKVKTAWGTITFSFVQSEDGLIIKEDLLKAFT